MTKAHILVRDLDFPEGGDFFNIAGGQFVRIGSEGPALLARCGELFGNSRAFYTDWLYTKEYAAVPPSRLYDNPDNDPSPAGDIPLQSEDLLLALRLLHTGDVSFVSQSMVDDQGHILQQQQYRFFGAIATTHHYVLTGAEIPQVEALLQKLQTAAARSTWFSVARRFFLYGGAKEFNPYIDELDRIVDFAIALEAVLMFEHDFINRLIKKRAVALLGLNEEQARPVRRLLNDFYGYRSTIAHGDPLDIPDPAAFNVRMEKFELLVRAVLQVALQAIPAGDDQRREKLKELAAASDDERLDQLTRTAQRLENPETRQRVLAALLG